MTKTSPAESIAGVSAVKMVPLDRVTHLVILSWLSLLSLPALFLFAPSVLADRGAILTAEIFAVGLGADPLSNRSIMTSQISAVGRGAPAPVLENTIRTREIMAIGLGRNYLSEPRAIRTAEVFAIGLGREIHWDGAIRVAEIRAVGLGQVPALSPGPIRTAEILATALGRTSRDVWRTAEIYAEGLGAETGVELGAWLLQNADLRMVGEAPVRGGAMQFEVRGETLGIQIEANPDLAQRMGVGIEVSEGRYFPTAELREADRERLLFSVGISQEIWVVGGHTAFLTIDGVRCDVSVEFRIEDNAPPPEETPAPPPAETTENASREADEKEEKPASDEKKSGKAMPNRPNSSKGKTGGGTSQKK